MKKTFVLLALSCLSTLAIATPPDFTGCQFSYQSDSFGLGIKSVFDNSYQSSRYLDPDCYNLGRQAAFKAIDESSFSSCSSEFTGGLPEGMMASPYSAGSACYWLGYKAGVAVLGVGARDGHTSVVGEECVTAYRRGQMESREGRASGPGNVSNKGAYCYQLGAFESHL